MIWYGILIYFTVILTGNVNGTQSIIKGKDANIADFPHQISLRHNNKHFCGGSIISEKHVLTAGHCFANKNYFPYDNVIAVSGTSYLDNEHGHRHKITNVTLHPDYLSEGYRALNDIAVITLKDSVGFDIHQLKINLPKHNYKVGEKAIVTGWGYVTQNPPTLPDRLQKLQVEIISTEECQKKLINPRRTKIHDTEICTVRNHDSGICMGDSGGPLIVHDEVVGIVSWFDGYDCASNHSDIYTNVYKYKNFIESTINHNH